MSGHCTTRSILSDSVTYQETKHIDDFIYVTKQLTSGSQSAGRRTQGKGQRSHHKGSVNPYAHPAEGECGEIIVFCGIIVFCVELLSFVLCLSLCYAIVFMLFCCFMLYCYCVVLLLFVLSYVLNVCTVPLPPGVNPIAVDKYININKVLRLVLYPTDAGTDGRPSPRRG